MTYSRNTFRNYTDTWHYVRSQYKYSLNFTRNNFSTRKISKRTGNQDTTCRSYFLRVFPRMYHAISVQIARYIFAFIRKIGRVIFYRALRAELRPLPTWKTIKTKRFNKFIRWKIGSHLGDEELSSRRINSINWISAFDCLLDQLLLCGLYGVVNTRIIVVTIAARLIPYIYSITCNVKYSWRTVNDSTLINWVFYIICFAAAIRKNINCSVVAITMDEVAKHPHKFVHFHKAANFPAAFTSF